MLPVVSEMLGCPASRTALPPLLPATLAALVGKEKTTEAAAEPRERPGDGHGQGRSRLGPEGSWWGQRGGMEV